MTRKDYVLIASVFKLMVDDATRVSDMKTIGILSCLASLMCSRFGSDNRFFDRDKFMTACGFEGYRP